MSKILPLEKDVNLDKRYINESETITEPALTAVINGGGGAQSSFPIIDLTHANFGKIEDAYVNDPDSRIGKDKFAQYLGITVDELDLLFTADFCAIKYTYRDGAVIDYLKSSAYLNTLVGKKFFDAFTFYMDSAGPYYGTKIMQQESESH